MSRTRRLVTVVAFLCLAPAADAQAPARYNVQPRPEDYPQASPKEAIASVLKAIDDKRIAYLLAQLSDPDWVDKRVRDVHGGDFDALVRETTDHFARDPAAVKLLRRFQKEGEWEEADNNASAKLKDVKEKVFFRKVQNRWVLENKKGP